MKNATKILFLAGALACSTIHPAHALFVKSSANTTVCTGAADGGSPMSSDAVPAAPTAAPTKKVRDVGKRQSVLQRFKTWCAMQLAGDNHVVALVLSIFIGWLGVDRFYLGHYLTGVLKLITLGGLGLWWFIDIILIAMGSLKPKGGDYNDSL